MKVFLSSLETGSSEYIISHVGQMNWNLCSYYYIRNQINTFRLILNHSKQMLIDSGAHSFQKGKKVDWEKYTHKYAEFIRKNDCSKILGYFEMDVDNIIGYDNVLMLRRILSLATDKVIPVWHKNRGIGEYQRMCHDYKGRIIAITGFKNEDIQDEQYPLFLKYAWEHGCKVHCLGMTRKNILDTVPFDFVDSSSWRQSAIYGKIGNRKVKRTFSSNNRNRHMYYAYLEGMKVQAYYYNKWRQANEN